MNTIQTLLATLADPSVSDAAACGASDQLAAAVDAVMRSPSPLADKIVATRIAFDRGWDGIIPAYLSILAAEAGAP